MSSEAAYRIVSSTARGKIVVATRDILPGEVVLIDHEPILTFSAEFLQIYKDEAPHELALALASFSTYLKVLTTEKKKKFTTLFGPTTGGFIETLRTFATENLVNSDDEKPRKLTSSEVETFVRVANVVRLHAFEEEGVGYSVYSEATLFAHSCFANCRMSLEGASCVFLAIRRIKVGDELTISYMPERDLLPTHIRRQKYFEKKEFTCHCSRCDARGDDTRQFNCCDPACRGVMFACQPINKERVAVTDAGVEYVEPHLMPCTECQKYAPSSYNAEMFTLEATLDDEAWRISERFEDLLMNRQYADMEVLLRDIRKFPRRHVASWPVLLVKAKIIDKLSMYRRGSATRFHLTAALLDYIAAQEKVFPGPNATVCGNLLAVCIMFCSAYAVDPVFSPEQEKELWQKGLRMYLILHGRETREPNTDTLLLGVLEKLPPLQSTDLCAFCEESPLRAAMTRTRCGTCKETVYCSVGCQKAHWKLHKMTCKAGTSSKKH